MAVPLPVAEAALERFFGYRAFRPGQVDVVAAVLSGRDTLAVLPTGGGKSLCYQVPALVLPGLALVLSPLISLMKDQVDRLLSRGVAAAFLNSTLPPADASRCLDAARRGVLKLLYLAPERLESGELLRVLAQCRIALVAVDEAHCISEWGHEFRPSFRRIAEATTRLGRPQIVALTATATPQVRTDIVRQLQLREPRVIVGGFDRPNLGYAVRRCRDDAEKDAVAIAQLRALSGASVVYAATRASVDRVARQFRRAGLRAGGYHGGMEADRRRAIQDEFMRGRINVIAATNAFGMGIDKPDVRLVIHHSMPGTIESYYQEAGRAGRDGAPARCLLLYAQADSATHEWFIAGTFPDPAVVRRVHDALRRIATRGRVPRDSGVVSRYCGGHSARDVEAALSLLERARVLVRDNGPARVRVRLLATPRRIERELPGGNPDRALLEALWPRGCVPEVRCLNLDELPHGLRGRPALLALDRLRAGQFVDWSRAEPAYQLARASLDGVIDWQHLGERRALELRKLDAMEDYARTRECRRKVLLSYFGQRGCPERCSGCDNCLHGDR